MLRSSGVAITLCVMACSGSDATSAPATPDGAISPPVDDGGTNGDASRPPATFLEPSTYGDFVVIDGAFPFGVTQRHAADDSIAGCHWGRHGGPMVTTGVYGASGPPTPVVIRWSIPDGATAPATSAKLPFAIATGLPAMHFYGADGFVDLPFGPYALLDYSGSGAAFPGEALLYAEAYDKVLGRANVNGLYSGAGVTDGTRQVLVYSGLSPLATAASTTNDNGLYAAAVCGTSLTAAAPCTAATKVLGWSGASGPVVTDAHGNVFVGASLAGASTSDAVYGLTKAQALAAAAVSPSPPKLAEIDSGGTASLAAVTPDGANEGWVLGLGFADDAAVYAASYVEGTGAIAKGSKLATSAIKKGTAAESLTVFSDPDGDLWLAVTTAKSGFFLELRRR